MFRSQSKIPEYLATFVENAELLWEEDASLCAGTKLMLA